MTEYYENYHLEFINTAGIDEQDPDWTIKEISKTGQLLGKELTLHTRGLGFRLYRPRLVSSFLGFLGCRDHEDIEYVDGYKRFETDETLTTTNFFSADLIPLPLGRREPPPTFSYLGSDRPVKCFKLLIQEQEHPIAKIDSYWGSQSVEFRIGVTPETFEYLEKRFFSADRNLDLSISCSGSIYSDYSDRVLKILDYQLCKNVLPANFDPPQKINAVKKYNIFFDTENQTGPRFLPTKDVESEISGDIHYFLKKRGFDAKDELELVRKVELSRRYKILKNLLEQTSESFYSEHEAGEYSENDFWETCSFCEEMDFLFFEPLSTQAETPGRDDLIERVLADCNWDFKFGYQWKLQWQYEDPSKSWVVDGPRFGYDDDLAYKIKQYLEMPFRNAFIEDTLLHASAFETFKAAAFAYYTNDFERPAEKVLWETCYGLSDHLPSSLDPSTSWVDRFFRSDSVAKWKLLSMRYNAALAIYAKAKTNPHRLGLKRFREQLARLQDNGVWWNHGVFGLLDDMIDRQRKND